LTIFFFILMIQGCACWILGRLVVCCMAFRPSQVYQLTGDKLCATVGVASDGTVWVLRRRLVEFLRADAGSDFEDRTMDQTTQAEVKGDIVNPPFGNAKSGRQCGQWCTCAILVVLDVRVWWTYCSYSRHRRTRPWTLFVHYAGRLGMGVILCVGGAHVHPFLACDY
jgi:hypothetical protein